MKKFLNSLGNVCAIIGAQWGDEAKGKATDILSEHYDVIARSTGGANAGHTVVVNGKKHVFHLLPSGCLHPGKPVILGAGMVIHLPTLLEEIQMLEEEGIEIIPRLAISSAAHIVFDFHKEVDAVMEERRAESGSQQIGTTKRGIGPAYMDKAARVGIRMEHLNTAMDEKLGQRAREVERLYGIQVAIDRELEHINAAREKVGGCVRDIVVLLNALLSKKKTILIEGAQGTLLDIDHGWYPYVTSSSTTSGGALKALGLPPRALTSCIGVAKAYCTRVGSGDFATEAQGEAEARLRERGGEYGATTGRPRRCGWLHIPDLQYAAFLNGFTHWNITKLDVLDEEDVIPVGVGKDANGAVLYEELPGWKTTTAGIRQFTHLPKNAQKYIEFIEEKTGIPVSLLGVGQGREDMIIRK